MFNFKKICKLMLIAALFCIFQENWGWAQVTFNVKPMCYPPCKTGEVCKKIGNSNMCVPFSAADVKLEIPKQKADVKYNLNGTVKANLLGECPDGYRKNLSNECVPNKAQKCPDGQEWNYIQGKCFPKTIKGSNTRHSESSVTGCSSNQGIFSGLINTGRKVFNGLRDLIYVVAGFGIIGVAVGGFFGNLNWKWLGAIVISLVVIATTGELISAITGCENFTQAMIEDTLK